MWTSNLWFIALRSVRTKQTLKPIRRYLVVAWYVMQGNVTQTAANGSVHDSHIKNPSQDRSRIDHSWIRLWIIKTGQHLTLTSTLPFLNQSSGSQDVLLKLTLRTPYPKRTRLGSTRVHQPAEEGTCHKWEMQCTEKYACSDNSCSTFNNRTASL